MASSDFLPFATGANALVTAQSIYAALPAVQTGFQNGVAEPDQFNKAMRQASFIAAAIAQFTATYTNTNITDNGDLSAFITKFRAAVGPDYAVDTGTANHVVVAIPSYGTGVQPGRVVSFKVAAANTGATTITINGLQMPLRYQDHTELASGELLVGRQIYAGITDAPEAVMLNPPIVISTALTNLITSISNTAITNYNATPVAYWRMDSPIQSIPSGGFVRIQNYTNLYHTMHTGSGASTLNQNNGTVTIGAADAGVYVLVATNAMDIPTTEESIAIFVGNSASPSGAAIAISRGVSGTPADAMDRSVSAMIRLAAGDTVWASYLQNNPGNSNSNTLNIPLGHFGGGRFGA